MSVDSKKVFVGLSGGVDSSVSAALLKRAGHDVTGVFIKVWSPDWLPCTWKDERRDAMRVAAALDISFLTFDFSAEYKKGVADYMIEEYKAGRTPNPDVMCNKEIKFGCFLKKALAMGADFIATGHYAQVTAKTELAEGADKSKDQSYFLWTLGRQELAHTLFPVGHLQKSAVRKLAERFRLPTAAKKDSQGICFIGDVDMKEFLAHYIETKRGDVLDELGKKIGTHDGAVLYTLGARHGFAISEKTPAGKPLYVVVKDLEKNTITVSARTDSNNFLQSTHAVVLKNTNFINGTPDENKTYGARIRYRQEKQLCKIKNATVSFTSAQTGVAVGQSLVVYDGEICLGGGVIDTVL